MVDMYAAISAATPRKREETEVNSRRLRPPSLALTLIEPNYLQPLWASNLGLSICVVVVSLLACGALLLRRIVAIDV